jgi:hypothetical protein
VAARKGVEHRRSRSVADESGHFHQISPPRPSLPLSLIPKHINREQFGMGQTVRVRQLQASQQECA